MCSLSLVLHSAAFNVLLFKWISKLESIWHSPNIYSSSCLTWLKFCIPNPKLHELKPRKVSLNPLWTESAKFCTALLKTHICDHWLWTSYNHSKRGICTSLEQSLFLSLEPELLAKDTKSWIGNSAWIKSRIQFEAPLPTSLSLPPIEEMPPAFDNKGTRSQWKHIMLYSSSGSAVFLVESCMLSVMNLPFHFLLKSSDQ